jgi:hypothetical protein
VPDYRPAKPLLKVEPEAEIVRVFFDYGVVDQRNVAPIAVSPQGFPCGNGTGGSERNPNHYVVCILRAKLLSARSGFSIKQGLHRVAPMRSLQQYPTHRPENVNADVAITDWFERRCIGSNPIAARYGLRADLTLFAIYSLSQARSRRNKLCGRVSVDLARVSQM